VSFYVAQLNGVVKISRKIRILTGYSGLQTKIILLRGFTSEETLLTQKEFANQLRRPLSSINYNVKSLKKKGILTRLNFLTPDGKVVFQKTKGYLDNTKKLRGHKIFGEFILTEDYKDFENVKDKYLKISNSPKHKGFKLEFKECVILFYSPRKINFYLPDVYGDGLSELYAVAYDDYIRPLQNYLGQIFPTLKINKHEIGSITINHLSFQHHPLAELFKELGIHYQSDRVEIDHSHGTPELETVHKQYSRMDMDKILDYEKLVRGSSLNLNDKDNSKKP